MSTWRYVVSLSESEEQGELHWEIRELYPSDSGSFAYTADAVTPFGNSYEELIKDLQHMLEDSKMEILDLRGQEPKLVPVQEILKGG